MKRLANVSKTMIAPLIFTTFTFRFILITIVPKIEVFVANESRIPFLLFCFWAKKKALKLFVFKAFSYGGHYRVRTCDPYRVNGAGKMENSGKLRLLV